MYICIFVCIYIYIYIYIHIYVWLRRRVLGRRGDPAPGAEVVESIAAGVALAHKYMSTCMCVCVCVCVCP